MEARKISRKDRLLVWLARIWIGLAIAFSVWETVSYTGVAAFFDEWEYDKTGASYPAITCLLMILLLSLPLQVIARVWQKYSKGQADLASSQHHAARTAALRSRNGFIVAALITACIIVAIGIFTLWLPDDRGPVHILAVTDATTPPILGATELRGRVLYDKITVLNEDAVLSHSRDRFAPIVGEGANQETFRYFVELPSDTPGLPPKNHAYFGVLRHGGLPGDLEKLYRYAGYKIPEDYYVLFSSRASMRREYLDYMVELNILLIFFVIMQFIFRFRMKQIDKSAQGPSAELSEPAQSA